MSDAGDVDAVIDIRNEPCDCPSGSCAHFVVPDADCINRLTGDVRTLHCEICGTTWHQDGACLRCRRHDPHKTDWANDCQHWRGRLLVGRYAHWCPDWDNLPIDETCPEWPCPCETALKESR